MYKESATATASATVRSLAQSSAASSAACLQDTWRWVWQGGVKEETSIRYSALLFAIQEPPAQQRAKARVAAVRVATGGQEEN